MSFRKEMGVSGDGQELSEPDRPGPQSCQVETYSGYRLHENPRRFTWQGKWLEVRRVLNRWQEPEHLCFIVTAADSRHYLLRYFRDRDVWEAQVWRASGDETG